MAVGIQDQYFGTEIEMTGITRQRGCGESSRTVWNKGSLRRWILWGLVCDRSGRKENGSSCMMEAFIRNAGSVDGMVRAGSEYSTEMVSPKLSYGEMGKLQEVVRCLRHHGAKVNASCGQHVHVDASNHTPRSPKNAMTIMYSKEDILFKALKVQTSREQGYCQKVRPIVLEDPPDAKQHHFHGRVGNGYGMRAGTGSNSHYDSTRYYALNLHAVFSKGTLVGDVLRVPSMQKSAANITLALAISALDHQSEMYPDAEKRRLQRIRHLPPLLFYWRLGLMDRNIRMSGNICFSNLEVTEHGDMTAVPMNV